MGNLSERPLPGRAKVEAWSARKEDTFTAAFCEFVVLYSITAAGCLLAEFYKNPAMVTWPPFF